MRGKRVVAVLFLAASVVACGDIVDWFAGSYQGQDRSGEPATPYLIIQAAPDSDQPRGPNLGTLVYIEAHGGDKLGLRVVSGSFQNYPVGEGGSTTGCLDVVQVIPLLIQPSQLTEAMLFVDLLQRPDAGVDGDVDAPSDAADAEAGAPPDSGDRPSCAGASCSCTAGMVAIRSAAAVISDTHVIVLDGGVDAAPAATDAATDAVEPGVEGGTGDAAEGG